MAFIKRLWKDRISEFPNRRTINDGNVTKQVTVGRDEGNITEEGDSFDASNMNDLEQRIEDAYGDLQGLVASEVAQQYDSSNVIFDAEPTEGHGTGYTVTSEGIKTAIDSGLVHTNTASGSLVHITDGADNIPVKSLVSEIVAVESGSGEKSPDNPYTILGWSDCLVAVTDNTDLQYISGLLKGKYDCADLTSLTWTYNNGNGFLNSTTDLPNAIQAFGGVPNAISGIDLPLVDANQLGNVEKGWTIYNRRFYLKNSALSEADLRSLLVGNYVVYKTGSTIKPTVTKTVLDGILTSFGINGNAYEFIFGQTVYGGYFDNKGNLVVTSQIIDLGDLTWSSTSGNMFLATLSGVKNVDAYSIPNSLCTIYNPTSWNTGTTQTTLDHIYCFLPNYNQLRLRDLTYSDASAFKSAVTGQKLVYELANPITLAITSQDIPTLLGENNIFSNCGDVEVTYYVDTEAIYAIRDVIDEFAMQSDWNEADNTKADYIKNKPTIPANADFSLSGLSDTDISSASAGQVLTFDGDNWVNSNTLSDRIGKFDTWKTSTTSFTAACASLGIYSAIGAVLDVLKENVSGYEDMSINHRVDNRQGPAYGMIVFKANNNYFSGILLSYFASTPERQPIMYIYENGTYAVKRI